MKWCLFVILLSGCVSANVVSREPASQALSPGGMSEDEERECEGYRCKYFIAPCSLGARKSLGRSPQMIGPEGYLSLKQETYLKEFEALLSAGYAQMSLRPLPEETYARHTCIFIFRK